MALDKKKILYVHHDGSFSGAPKSMSYIIKELDKKKFNAFLLNIAEGPVNDFFKELPCELILPKKGIRPFHGSYVIERILYHYLYGWFFLLPSIVLAYRHIKRIKPDLIHLNSTCLFAVAIAAYLLKIKTICHVREPIRKGWAGWPLRFFNKTFVSGFIAISQFDLASLQLRDKTKIPHDIIYNFVEKFSTEPTDLESDFRKNLNIDKEDILFLYLARFADFNGWRELITMANKVIETNSNAHFVLVGADKDEQFIYNSNNIHIVRFRPNIEEVLKSSDVFVCPFISPHFARGIIESSAYCIPTIGNNIGGVNELIKTKQTGYLYNSEEEFIYYCQSLIKDRKLLEKLGKEGYDFAQKNFNAEKNLKRTYDFYNQFLE